MRLIPSVSPEAAVSGQGRQGVTPSGPHQCCSASSWLVEEAGLRLEQSSIRNLQAVFVEAAVSCTDRCGYSHGCCRAQGTRSWGEIQVLAAARAKAPLRAEVGHCPRAHTVAGFSVQGAAQACSFSRGKLPSPGCPRKGSFWCPLGLMNYCSGSSPSSAVEQAENGREVWRCLFQSVVGSVLGVLPFPDPSDRALGTSSLSCPPL